MYVVSELFCLNQYVHVRIFFPVISSVFDQVIESYALVKGATALPHRGRFQDTPSQPSVLIIFRFYNCFRIFASYSLNTTSDFVFSRRKTCQKHNFRETV